MNLFIFQIVPRVVLIGAGISTTLAFVFSINTGVSFMLGAGINIIPTLLFGWIFFKKQHINLPKKMVNAFYLGEAVKILTTIVLFALVFQWKELRPFFLFLGFVTAQLGFVLAPLSKRYQQAASIGK